MFTRIVVGVDCREGGRDALALAALLQAAGGGELLALHACAPEPLLREDVLSRVEGELARAGVPARAVVVTDRSPAHALRTIAERDAADLIVVGSSHRAGVDRVLAGDDAFATLHCAPCAVAVAPRGFAGSPRALRRIGVGLDESRESRLALALACRLAHWPAPTSRHHRRARARAVLAGDRVGPRLGRLDGVEAATGRAAARRDDRGARRRRRLPRSRWAPPWKELAARSATSTCSSWAPASTGRCVGWCSGARRRNSRATQRVRCW